MTYMKLPLERIEHIEASVAKLKQELFELKARLEKCEECDWDYIGNISPGDFEAVGHTSLFQCSNCKAVKLG